MTDAQEVIEELDRLYAEKTKAVKSYDVQIRDQERLLRDEIVEMSKFLLENRWGFEYGGDEEIYGQVFGDFSDRTDPFGSLEKMCGTPCLMRTYPGYDVVWQYDNRWHCETETWLKFPLCLINNHAWKREAAKKHKEHVEQQKTKERERDLAELQRLASKLGKETVI